MCGTNIGMLLHCIQFARLEQSYGLFGIHLLNNNIYGLFYMRHDVSKYTIDGQSGRHQDDVWGNRSLERTLYSTGTPSATVRSLMHMATV